MSPQRKTRIKILFKKEESNLIRKAKSYNIVSQTRVILFNYQLGKYNCILQFNSIENKFTSIHVIEETIEL